MPLYTGVVWDGQKHKARGLIRYLTLSRLSDNAGIRPDKRLWMPQKDDLYDIYYPVLAPDEKDVRDWYFHGLSWENFSEKYLKKIKNGLGFNFLLDLSRKAVEEDLHPDKEGIILQCVCSEVRFCHRRILAEEIKLLVEDRWGHDLMIKNV
mgnify:CR=1 FL=1